MRRRRRSSSWLGVVTYLSQAAVFATLGVIAGLASGAEVVFSYSDPPQSMAAEQAAAHARRAARVAALGEPWLTSFSPPVLHRRLREMGFTVMEDFRPDRHRDPLSRRRPPARPSGRAGV